MAGPSVIRIGSAPSAPAADKKKKKKKNPSQRGASIVVAAPPAPEQIKRRTKRKGGALKRKGDMMSRLGVKSKGYAIAGAYAGNRFLAGKSTNGIPHAALAGLLLAYMNEDGKNDWMEPVSDGLVTYGAVEYAIMQAIRSGTLPEALKPLIAGVQAEGGDAKVKADALAASLGLAAAAGDEVGVDARIMGLADRMANGG